MLGFCIFFSMLACSRRNGVRSPFVLVVAMFRVSGVIVNESSWVQVRISEVSFGIAIGIRNFFKSYVLSPSVKLVVIKSVVPLIDLMYGSLLCGTRFCVRLCDQYFLCALGFLRNFNEIGKDLL